MAKVESPQPELYPFSLVLGPHFRRAYGSNLKPGELEVREKLHSLLGSSNPMLLGRLVNILADGHIRFQTIPELESHIGKGVTFNNPRKLYDEWPSRQHVGPVLGEAIQKIILSASKPTEIEPSNMEHQATTVSPPESETSRTPESTGFDKFFSDDDKPLYGNAPLYPEATNSYLQGIPRVDDFGIPAELSKNPSRLATYVRDALSANKDSLVEMEVKRRAIAFRASVLSSIDPSLVATLAPEVQAEIQEWSKRLEDS